MLVRMHRILHSLRIDSGTWALAALMSSLLLPGIAHADGWEAMSGDCIKALGQADKVTAKRLLECADSFSSEARLDKLTATDRAAIEKGLRWMYEHGDATAESIARSGLVRLDIRLAARGPREAGSQPVAAVDTERKKYDPPEAKDADRGAADKLADDAIKLLKKKKWADGVKVLEKAVEKDPRNEKALYNLACGEANMDAKRSRAVEHLQYLADLGGEDATRRLVKARTDPDLEPVRETPDFKRVTGYVRVQVINTIGSPGEKAVENIQKLLAKLEQRKADEKDEDKPLDTPTIQFKPYAKAQTSLIADLLKSPNVRLDPITFETKYDIIVRWGTKVENGKPFSLGPDTGDEAIADARKKQNKILAHPDAALNKVNKVLNTPDRAYSEAQAAGSRVEATANKAKGAAEKMKSLGEKLNKL